MAGKPGLFLPGRNLYFRYSSQRVEKVPEYGFVAEKVRAAGPQMVLVEVSFNWNYRTRWSPRFTAVSSLFSGPAGPLLDPLQLLFRTGRNHPLGMAEPALESPGAAANGSTDSAQGLAFIVIVAVAGLPVDIR